MHLNCQHWHPDTRSIPVPNLFSRAWRARGHEPGRDGALPFTISGPRIKIQSRANVAIALAFHELSTNAVKYGSLAYGDGNVDIHWTVVANG